jgi:4-methyl-5(b-hydroxyethyl)-thiazole monophosphate biosynthesis
LDDKPVKASRGLTLLPDVSLDQVLDESFDMIVLPGGQPGADNLNSDPRIHDLLKRTAEAGKYTAAICAAPKVLATAGLLNGRKATSYPGVLDKMDLPSVDVRLEPVVIDDKIMTSRGPGTAMEFALELVEILAGQDKRNEVEKALVR